jgi:hypothetical protein
MNTTAVLPPARHNLVLVSHEAFLPRAARPDIGDPGQARSDAVVSVLHEWLHNPGNNADAEVLVETKRTS